MHYASNSDFEKERVKRARIGKLGSEE